MKYHQDGMLVTYLLITENADEKTVAELIHSGSWNCVSRSQLDGATLVRSIRGTPALDSMQKEQRSTEEPLRKPSSAVEQSPDTVAITDWQGAIEYVNPACEATAGYKNDEVRGRT